jgi:hypothetical protein
MFRKNVQSIPKKKKKTRKKSRKQRHVKNELMSRRKSRRKFQLKVNPLFLKSTRNVRAKKIKRMIHRECSAGESREKKTVAIKYLIKLCIQHKHVNIIRYTPKLLPYCWIMWTEA